MSQLDGDAQVKERTEKLYRVRIIQGSSLSRLVKVGGGELTEARYVRRRSQHEAAFEKGFSGRDPKKAVAKHEALITKDMMDLFQCTVLRREAIHGRQTVVVSFEGKPGKGGGGIQERMLSRMAGTLWVDEETADMARVEVHLTKGFAGLSGRVGTIKDCQMDLESKPMTDGMAAGEDRVIGYGPNAAVEHAVQNGGNIGQLQHWNQRLQPPCREQIVTDAPALKNR